MRRGLAAGTMELLALERLLSERRLWDEIRAEPPAREREPVPAVAGADDQPR